VLAIWWGAPWKLTSHDAIAPLKTKSHSLIINPPSLPPSLPFHHTLFINLGGVKVVNNVFPFLTSKIKYYCCPDLNVIPNTFLKATSTISIPPYVANLTNLNEDRITMF